MASCCMPGRTCEYTSIVILIWVWPSSSCTTVHSSYRRKPRDLPCTGQPIRLLLSVRKFFCRAATCPRKIFTEQLPELIKPSSRLTTRLRTLMQAITSALNGKGGARLGEQIGFHFSRMTFLRALHLLPTPTVEHVRVVGLDDFGATRSRMCSCKDSRKEVLPWGSAPECPTRLNQVRLGQCSRVHQDGNRPVRRDYDC
jgi:hypothetical protein